MIYESQKVYFTTYTDGSEGLTYTLSLDNDYDILVFDQQNNLISSLPIKIEATVLANGDALNEEEYGIFSLSIEGSVWKEGEHYSFDKKDGILQINKVPAGFKEASFKFSWTRKEDEKPLLSKTFSLKKNISNTDLSLLVEKTVVNSSQKGGRIGVWIVCKDINGIIELDPGWVERVYIEAKVNGKEYYVLEDDGRGFIEYEQGHTDPITVTLRDNGDNFLWDVETIEFVQDGEKGDEALVYNGSIETLNNLTMDLPLSNFNRDPQKYETFYVMCSGRYFVKFEVVQVAGYVTCEIKEINDLTGPMGTPGEDGNNTRYVYYLCKGTADDIEAMGTIMSLKGDSTNLPKGWEDSPLGITPDDPYEYVSISTKPAGTNTTWSTFSTPVIWSKWGENGQDGDGVEYQFYLSTSSSAPENYRDVSGWTDEPSGVTKEKPYEYVIKMKVTHSNGEVTEEPVGKPSLWAKWSEDGVDALVYNGTLQNIGNVGDKWNLMPKDFNRVPQKDETFYAMCAGRYYVKFKVESVGYTVLCEIIEKNDLTGPEGAGIHGSETEPVRIYYLTNDSYFDNLQDLISQLPGPEKPPSTAFVLDAWTTRQLVADELYKFLWSCTGHKTTTYSDEKGEEGSTEYKYDWTTPELYSAWMADNISGEKAATFYKLFGFDSDNTSEAIKYDEKGKAYISAEFIKAGTLTVSGNKGTVFSADIDSGSVVMGGWKVEQGLLASQQNNVFLCPESIDGIIGGVARKRLVFKAGDNFGVDSAGTLYATKAKITGEVVATSLKLGDNAEVDSRLITSEALEEELKNLDISIPGDILRTGNVVQEKKLDDNGVEYLLTTVKGAGENGTGITYATYETENYVVFGRANGTDSTAKNYFAISKEGLLTANNAVIYGDIHASTGYIGDWEISDGLLSSVDKKVFLCPNGMTVQDDKETREGVVFKAGNNFEVNKDGILRADGAKITGDIVATTLKLGSDEALEDLGIELPDNIIVTDKVIEQEGGGESGTSFLVSRDGLLTAKNAIISGLISASIGDIGGWNISENGLTCNNLGLLSNNELAIYSGGNIQYYESVKNVTFDSGSTYTLTIPNCSYICSVSASVSSYDLPYGAGVVYVQTAFPAQSNQIRYTTQGNGVTGKVKISCFYSNANQVPFFVTKKGELYADQVHVTKGYIRFEDPDDKWVEVTSTGGVRILSPDFNFIGKIPCAQYSAHLIRYGIATDYESAKKGTTGAITNYNSIDFNFTAEKPFARLDGDWVNKNDTSILSDANLKNHIEYLDDRYDQLFDSLYSRRFMYNDGTSSRYHTGYIAQEVQSALKAAQIDEKEFAALCTFAGGTEEEFMALRYDEFVSLNTWQIQKLKPRVSSLEQTILNYESRISALENEIQNLKKS